KERTQLSKPENKAIYGRRKIDVEPIFGKTKAYLHFHRYSVRGLEKVKKETGILVLALNILKLVSTREKWIKNQEHRNKARNQNSVSCLILVL
ncbi:transposase, partial [Levilactobacillus lindianensis]|uniref:transposase n=1 Tax=Levilactobacillus lindianensis TaxID=2486018 RepID=UPI0013DDA1C9